MVLAMPLASRAIDQTKIDNMIFFLMQPEANPWGDGIVFSDSELYEGLETIFQQAVNDGNTDLETRAVWAMGETGIGIFDTSIISAYDVAPETVLYSLGKIPSEAGVELLISALDDDDMFVREAAVWGLGKVPYNYGLEDSQQTAIDALNLRLAVEDQEFITQMINAAIVYIQTGVVTNAAFEEDTDTN